MSWEETRNIAGILSDVHYASMPGYAGQSIVLGRALYCGYNVFSSLWRDSKYDAILDANGALFRIEIKKSESDSISCIGGWRAGGQIADDAEDRTRILSTDICDFEIGVEPHNGNCWIIPVELIEIMGRKTLKICYLEIFKEKWSIFSGCRLSQLNLTSDDLRRGFIDRSTREIFDIYRRAGLPIPSNNSPQRFSLRPRTAGMRSRYMQSVNMQYKQRLVADLWKHIFSSIQD